MNRIQKNLKPIKFFITKGSGSHRYEFHAGAYHMALWDAGISDYNIQTYSSVLPKDYEIVSQDKIDLPEFGSEMKMIMACAKGRLGESIAAGIVYASLYEDEDLEKPYGGFVCEITGFYRHEEIEERLLTVINDLFKKTYKTKGLHMGEPTTIIECYTVEDNYGCSIVSLSCVEYEEVQ